MPLFPHRHSSRKIGADHPLSGKVVYIPTMGEGSPEAFAAAFRWLGVQAQTTPPSDERTRELGGKYTTGDECYPAKVTVGDFLRVIEQPGFDAEHTAFFMPTAEGPCRFGQYAPFLRKILRDAGWGNVQVLSPTSRNGYVDLGDIANPFLRTAWRALVSADTIHRALLKTRPYETTPGAADRAFQESQADMV
jgi:predicted nucleotide-binding protein (sugar kinase/HSP70/actin superfamily)